MNDDKKVVVLGIGGGAGKIIRCIATQNVGEWIRLVHLDTDQHDISQPSEIESHLIKNEWVDGQGCGGDPTLGENTIREYLPKIKDSVTDAQLLIVVTCLGRGLGSGGAQAITRLVKDENILTFFFVTVPFGFEGSSNRSIAENSLVTLRKQTDIVIAIQNDLLFTQFSDNQQVSEIFDNANRFLADGIIGIAELVRCKGLISIDFPSLKSVLKKREAFCSFGIGRADGEGKESKVVDNLFQSPLLGGREFVNKSDVIVATLVGGESMNMGEMKQCLNTLNAQLNSTTKTIIGANVNPEKNDMLQISVLSIQYPKRDQNVRRRSPSKKNHAAFNSKKSPLQLSKDSADPAQPTLPFTEDGYSLGIFSEAPATIYDGQNLDIPTFQRIGIKLKLGNGDE